MNLWCALERLGLRRSSAEITTAKSEGLLQERPLRKSQRGGPRGPRCIPGIGCTHWWCLAVLGGAWPVTPPYGRQGPSTQQHQGRSHRPPSLWRDLAGVAALWAARPQQSVPGAELSPLSSAFIRPGDRDELACTVCFCFIDLTLEVNIAHRKC